MPKGAGEAKAEETKRKSVLGKHGAHFRVQEIPPYKPHPIIGFLCAGSPEMNEKLKNASIDVKRNAKTPIWYWSGLGIIAILIATLLHLTG